MTLPTDLNPDLARLAERLAADAPSGLDLTDPAQEEHACTAADALLASDATSSDLDALEAVLATRKEAYPLLLHLAVKLARSRRLLEATARGANGHGEVGARYTGHADASNITPLHLSVVFAVYKEHHRILRGDQHPHGEDFLIRKIGQLQWLFADLPQSCRWDLTVVDDGCPEKSGELAEQILASRYGSANVQVLYLADAIADELPVIQPLRTTAESQKGGAIAYGLWNVVQTPRAGHIALFTDADLSTHLGQCGLLIDPLTRGDRDAAIGSRREPTSVVVKKGVRNLRGKLFIYLWKRLLANLDHIVDTQCGFKAFRAEVVREIVDDLLEKRFAFDIELLLKTELRQPGSVVKIPIAWIDSEAASTTSELQPYLPMLRSMAKMYRKYLPPVATADSFAAFIEELTEDDWNRLLDQIPPAITEREPAEFGTFAGVSVDDLRAVIRDR